MVSPRVSVVVTRPLLAFLEREAERLDVSVSEVCRRLLDRVREEREGAAERANERKPGA